MTRIGIVIVHKVCGKSEVCSLLVGACGLVDSALSSRSKGLGFDSNCWSCVKAPGKLHTPYVLMFCYHV